jgi:polyhydroxyalkanoate synthesis regulator phasin
MGRYPKDMPEEEKLRRIKENRKMRNIRYRYIYHGNWLERFQKKQTREIQKVINKRERARRYRIENRNKILNYLKKYRKLKVEEGRLLGSANTNYYSTNLEKRLTLARKLRKAGLEVPEEVLKVATKKDIDELIKNYELLPEEKKRMIEEKKKEVKKKKEEEEEPKPKTLKEEYRDWQYWLIPIIFFGSLMLGILAVRYGINLFSLFGQVF